MLATEQQFLKMNLLVKMVKIGQYLVNIWSKCSSLLFWATLGCQRNRDIYTGITTINGTCSSSGMSVVLLVVEKMH